MTDRIGIGSSALDAQPEPAVPWSVGVGALKEVREVASEEREVEREVGVGVEGFEYTFSLWHPLSWRDKWEGKR